MLMRCAGKVLRLQRLYRRLGVGARAVAMLGHTLRERNTADGPTPPQPLWARGFAAAGCVGPPARWHRI
ncbi:MAG TPA: hypothetical protein VNB06_00250, partial [Thermoanaerobaculia bacterium]|nr:hypothetical protein [Thermoanaerobaculia bacterium]